MVFETGVSVVTEVAGDSLGVLVLLPNSMKKDYNDDGGEVDHLEGLLGNYDGTAENDLVDGLGKVQSPSSMSDKDLNDYVESCKENTYCFHFIFVGFPF